MENIKEAILDLRYQNTYVDALKSDYLLLVQSLMLTIFDAEKSMTPKHEEQIKFYITGLTNLKEELLAGLDDFTDKVKLLSYELEGDD